MSKALGFWIQQSRMKLRDGRFGDDDLDALERLVARPVQCVLYLVSKAMNLRAPIVGWSFFDPSRSHEPSLPTDQPPYDSVLDALRDGWRIVQFPDPKHFAFSETDNDYLGYEYILERVRYLDVEGRRC
jgi:hypothetical protein